MRTLNPPETQVLNFADLQWTSEALALVSTVGIGGFGGGSQDRAIVIAQYMQKQYITDI